MTDISIGRHRILVGDVSERLRHIPDNSVQCCVTSPPYFNLRDYGVAGQIGLEPTLADYLATMVDVFREVRRVLRPDGTVWLNIGDSYHTDSPVRKSSAEAFSETWDPSQTASRGGLRKSAAKSGTFKNKDLMMVPARLAIALQDDGWWLRSDIIWAKKAPMPEGATDRPTSAHEHVFLLAKQPRYYYDADAVKEDASGESYAFRNGLGYVDQGIAPNNTNHQGKSHRAEYDPTKRNSRNVWLLGPEPFPEAHFATYPTEIPRRAIKAGTSEYGVCASCGSPWVRQVERAKTYGSYHDHVDDLVLGQRHEKGKKLTGSDYYTSYEPPKTTGWAPSCACNADVIPATVLDPFLGSGTTMLVAEELNRVCIGIELNPEYAAMAERRIRSTYALLVGGYA